MEIHFVWYSAKGSGKVFSLLESIALKSAIMMNPNSNINLWINCDVRFDIHIEGINFRVIPDEYLPKSSDQLEPIHVSDIIRINILLDHGGTYLDLDIISLKSIEDLRFDKVAMISEFDDVSLCGVNNSVIFSGEDNRYLEHQRYTILSSWELGYATPGWISCHLPMKSMPEANMVTLLNPDIFQGLKSEGNTPWIVFSESISILRECRLLHLWNNLPNLNHFTRKLTKESIESEEFPICKLLRKYL